MLSFSSLLSVRVARAAGFGLPGSIKSEIESKSRGETNREEARNWPPLLSYVGRSRFPGASTRPAESLIFPGIYLIIARLTTSSFTSKGIECRQFPDATTPSLHLLQLASNEGRPALIGDPFYYSSTEFKTLFLVFHSILFSSQTYGKLSRVTYVQIEICSLCRRESLRIFKLAGSIY